MKRNMLLSALAILVITLLAQVSFARIPTTGKLDDTARRASMLRKYREVSGTTEIKKTEVLSPYKFSTAVTIAYEQKAEENQKGVRDRALGLTLVPKFSFYDFSLRGDFIYVYDLNAPRVGTGWLDGVISLLYDGWKVSAVKLSPYTSVELPLSKESRENREIKLVNNFGFLATLDTKSLDIPELSMSYSAAYGYYTNEYTTRVNGEPATEYKIVQTFKAGYKFNPLFVAFKFQYTNAYSYEDVVRDGFLHYEALGFGVSESLSFSLYHYNKAPFLKDTTYENNLKTYDATTSTVGLSMDMTF
jgi:hypothetical protein